MENFVSNTSDNTGYSSSIAFAMGNAASITPQEETINHPSAETPSPIIVKFPDMRNQTGETISCRVDSPAKSQAISANTPATFEGSYEEIEEVLRTGSHEIEEPVETQEDYFKPRLHREHVSSNSATLTDIAPRTERSHRSANQTAQQILPDDLYSISADPASTSSWKPVVILAIVLLSAVGLTFWIFQGSQTPAPIAPTDGESWQTAGNDFAPSSKSSTWPNSPVTVKESSQKSQQEMMPPNYRNQKPFPIENRTILPESWAKSGQPKAAASGTTRVATRGRNGSMYPTTDYPTEWQLPTSNAQQAPAGQPHAESNLNQSLRGGSNLHDSSTQLRDQRQSINSTSNERAATPANTKAPVASFQGTIETPNLRANYDNKRSSLY